MLAKNLKPKTNLSKWSDIENKVMQDYYTILCKKVFANDKTNIRLHIEGPTFTRMKRSLRVSFTDKLGSIGGTLGLFSGFSLLAIMEMIHWIVKIINSAIFPKK